MPSLRTFRIEFDRANATYAPDELITGNVIIEVAKEKIIRALKVSFKGEANVRLENADLSGGHSRAKEQYFNLDYYLLGNTDNKVRIPAGIHKYPFTYELAHKIPCSFEHAEGYIRYTTTAVIDRPWKDDHECKTAFTVITPYDLNSHRQECLGIDDEMAHRFYSFCCIDLGLIRLRIRIPTTGFVPGQSIEAMVNLDNTSSIDLTKICLKLQRNLKLITKRRNSKTIVTTVKSEVSMGPFNKDADILLRLQIPSISPSHLEFCSIIDPTYCVHITFHHVSGMHCSISRTYPILIGTIPLRSTVPSQTPRQPTAAVMHHDYDPPRPTVPYPSQLGFSNQLSISTN